MLNDESNDAADASTSFPGSLSSAYLVNDKGGRGEREPGNEVASCPNFNMTSNVILRASRPSGQHSGAE